MKQAAFEALYEPLWQSFESWLESRERGERSRPDAIPASRLPSDYRRVCHHLALARRRQYSPALVARLNHLALAGHRHFYAGRSRALGNLARFFARDFPRAVRSNWPYVLIMGVLFYGTFAAMFFALKVEPELVYSLLSPEQVRDVEFMYEPEQRTTGARASDQNVAMFGYYIMNNVSIGFRSFASGLLFGIGALFVVAFNGVFLGGIIGHLSHTGYATTLWPFIAGHSALELNGIVLSGAAGMKIGWSLLSPGRRRRAEALRVAARDSMPLVYGFTTMLLLAAFVEGFWSSNGALPVPVKYAAGALGWVVLAVYFTWFGRGYGSRED